MFLAVILLPLKTIRMVAIISAEEVCESTMASHASRTLQPIRNHGSEANNLQGEKLFHTLRQSNGLFCFVRH